MNDPTRNRILPVKLSNGMNILVEARLVNPEEDVAYSIPEFEEFTKVVESIATSIREAIQKVKPQKASVEFGLEIGAESGHLTALLVKGTGTANLKITLEWE